MSTPSISVTTSETEVQVQVNLGVKGDKGDTGGTGATGAAGADGADGEPGVGVPTGGTTGQVLVKASNEDHDTQWDDPSGGSPDIIQPQRHSLAIAGTSTPLRVMPVGDSLSTQLLMPPNIPVVGYFSQGTLVTAGSTPTDGEKVSTDWINGRVAVFKVGSTVQFHHDGGVDLAYDCNKFAVGFIADDSAGVGVGSFDIEMMSPQHASGAWVKVGSTQSTYNATKNGVWTVFDVPATSLSPQWKIRATNITGKDVKMCVWGAYRSNVQGGIFIKGVGNLSGQDVTGWALVPDAVFNTIWTGLAPDLLLSRWADAAADWDTGGAWRTQYARIKALKAATDVVQISAGPIYGGADSGAAWPAYYTGQSQYRVNDIAVATHSTTLVQGRYVCTQPHTQSADKKPGEGVNWTSYWTAFSYDAGITASSQSNVEAQIAAQQAWALEEGQTFINGYDVFGTSYLDAFTKGLTEDFVHPSPAGWRKLNSYLASVLPISRADFGLPGGDNSVFKWRPTADSQTITSNFSLQIDAGAVTSLMIRARDDGDRRDKFTVISQTGDTATINVNNSNILEVQQSALSGIQPASDGMTLGTTSRRWRGFVNGLSAANTSKTSTYTATAADYLIACDATSGAFTINLPDAAGSGMTGRIYIIKKVDASGNAITVDPFLSQTIDGATTATISSQWQGKVIQSNGSNWLIIGTF